VRRGEALQSLQRYGRPPLRSRLSPRRRRLDAKQGYAADWGPVRIATDFSNVNLAAGSKQLIYLQDTLIPAAVDFWRMALAVRSVQGPLKLSGFCESVYKLDLSQFGIDPCAAYASVTTCAGHPEVTIPAEHISRGIDDVDFILYVSNKEMDAGVEGYAVTCQRDQFGRPIAGMINLTPTHITETTDTESAAFVALWQQELNTALHELSHALGFSSSSYAHMVDAGGNAVAESDVVRSFVERGETVTKLVTPLMSARAADHFACHR
jgi:hypothetical protein